MPDPLVAAAEALLESGLDYDGVVEVPRDAFHALRAALAAHRQRDERAEAAVAVMEAEAHHAKVYGEALATLKGGAGYVVMGERETGLWAAVDEAIAAYDAARRRWAEVESVTFRTCGNLRSSDT